MGLDPVQNFQRFNTQENVFLPGLTVDLIANATGLSGLRIGNLHITGVDRSLESYFLSFCLRRLLDVLRDHVDPAHNHAILISENTHHRAFLALILAADDDDGVTVRELHRLRERQGLEK